MEGEKAGGTGGQIEGQRPCHELSEAAGAPFLKPCVASYIPFFPRRWAIFPDSQCLNGTRGEGECFSEEFSPTRSGPLALVQSGLPSFLDAVRAASYKPTASEAPCIDW